MEQKALIFDKQCINKNALQLVLIKYKSEEYCI